MYDPKIIQILRNWETLAISHVIPGHGNVVDKQFIIDLREYFEELLKVLTKLKNSGINEKEVVNHRDLPEYFGRSRENWIEGGETHTVWLDALIVSWFNSI